MLVCTAYRFEVYLPHSALLSTELFWRDRCFVSKEGEATNWGCQDDTCTKKKGTEKSRPQLLEVQDKGLDQFFTSFTYFTRMASWTSGQVEFWQDRHANQIASGVQGGLLVYILVVPTAVDPADRQPFVYNRC